MVEKSSRNQKATNRQLNSHSFAALSSELNDIKGEGGMRGVKLSATGC